MNGQELYELYCEANEDHDVNVGESWDDLDETDKAIWNQLAKLATRWLS